MTWKTTLLTPVMLVVVASLLAGCGTSLPSNVSNLKNVVGTELPGAKGQTFQDQDRIDSAVAGLCGAKIYGKELCDFHTNASAKRLQELNV